MNVPLRVLIVDDEASERTGLAGIVEAWGMKADMACDGAEALEKLASFSADVIITDLHMPGIDGYTLLQRLQEIGDTPPAIVLTAFGSIEAAVKAVKDLGAYWFLEKPVQADVMQVLLRRAAAQSRLHSTNRNLQRQMQYQGSLGELIGQSAKMQEVFALLQQAGPTNAGVLISGESGTGKELVARTIHALNPNRQGPFFAINCAALPDTLIESELFGHEIGAFTGASERRSGCFEVAQNGTLLLDEIGEMPMLTQAKLLRVLEDSKVRRLGGKAEFKVDVRVVAATNKVPEEAVRTGRLRKDLYYRLNVFHIHLPALRERTEDIPLIAGTLLVDLNRKHGCRVSDISEPVLEAFRRHSWPGNVRELRNVLERALIVAAAGSLKLKHLSPPFQVQPANGAAAAEFPIGTTVSEAERLLIFRVIAYTGNNKRRAALLLGISLRTLQNKLKEYRARENAR